ncbi:amidohydrolase family protein [Desulfonatronum parangueonense]
MKWNKCAPIQHDEENRLFVSGRYGSSAVISELNRLADRHGPRLGMTRRDFLKSQMGLAASFLALNSVFGHFFHVNIAEASDPGMARDQIERYAHQFIFDVQVHYLHEEFPEPENLLALRRAADDWNPKKDDENHEFEDLLFENFYREVFVESQTTCAVLSNAPSDDKEGWFLTNEQALATREKVNSRTGKRSLLGHAVITPGQPGWEEELDRSLELKPDAIKGYTIGDPVGESEYPWRLDDEKLVYPAYEKIQNAGIRNICIHKGLLPVGYEQNLSPELVAYANVDDVGQAAKDWPDLNFIIYHSAIERVVPIVQDVDEFQRTGRIKWVTDLSEIPEKYGVANVYAELGAVFAATSVAHPYLCAGILGTLIKNMGADHVCWGTDSVWFGSPQWQIEALRRFEIPETVQKLHGFEPLGPADGKVKNKIFGENSARLYGIDPADYVPRHDNYTA